MRKIIKYLTLLSLLFSAAEASVIGISIHDTTVFQGQLFYVPIHVDSISPDQNVTSFQLQLGFSGSILTVDSVISDGTLSQLFGSLYFNKTNPNQVSIAGAGSSPLSGSGVLVYVRFRAVGAGYTGVAFSDAAHNMLNEGTPAVALQSGSVYVQPAPSIGVSPNTALLTVGDSLLFGGYGGTAPYRWAVTNGVAASIDSTGLLKATHSGLTRVIATDYGGIIDTSGIVEIRAFRLSIHDTSMVQGRTFDLPVYTTDLTGINVTSGSMQITFNSSILTPVSVTQSGSLLAAYSSVAFNTKTPGQVNISFAGASPLEGKGVLFFVRFVVSPTNSGGTSVSLSSALFNENLPGNVSGGNLTIIVPPPVYVSPSTATLVAGDTIRFYASNGTPPYVWVTTDTTIAQVDSFGLVTARRGGTVRVVARDFLGSTATTNDIVVYDALVSIPEVHGKMSEIVDVPITVDRFTGGNSVSSAQITLVYDTTIIRAIGIVTTGTLIEGWSTTMRIPGDRFVLAAAGASGFQSTGTLVKVRFRVDSGLSYGQRAYINFQQILLNEGKPSALAINGGVTAVEVPQLISPANGAINQPTDLMVYWTTPSYTGTFHLQVGTDSMFTTVVVDDSMLAGASDHVTALANNTLYYWRVNAAKVAGSVEWSDVWSFTTIVAPPHVPILMAPLAGATNQPTSIVLSWHSVNGMKTQKLMAAAQLAGRGRHVADAGVTYHMQLATDSSFAGGMMLDTLGIVDTSVVVNGLNNNTTFYWRVSATNIGGVSEWSGFWDFTTIVAPPGAPILVAPPGGSTNQPTSITLVWNSSPTAASKLRAAARPNFKAGVVSGLGVTYRVQLGTDSGFVHGIVADTSIVDTFLAVTGLANNITYYWHVSATNIGGTGVWSGVLNFMTISLAPAAPMLVSPPDRSADQPTSLTLLWNSLPGAMTHDLHAIPGQLSGKRYLEAAGITYHAQLARDSEFVIVLFDSSAIVDTSVAVSGLANNVTYYWHVNATNAGGTGPWSAARRFTTVLTGVGNDDLLPTEYKLAQNYPNPFNPTTNFQFSIVNCQLTILEVYDVLGRKVAALVNEVMQPGEYTVVWNATKMPSGVYYYRLQAGTFIETKKLLLMK